MKKVAALLALALSAFALVACGGDDEDTPTTTGNPPAEETGSGGGSTEGAGNGQAGEPSTLEFETPSGAELAFTTDEAVAKAGKVTVELNNVQAVPHDVAFEEESGKTIGQTETITDSSTSTVVNFKPGTYTFYCSVPGHRPAGMEGTLIVE